MDVKIRVCLPRKYGRFMLLIDNNLLLPGARSHRHHHKFFNNMKNDWEKKEKTCSAYLSSKIFALQREFGRVAHPWVRSNGPTDPLHISCICSIWKILLLFIFLSESVKVRFLPRVDTFSFAQEPHVAFFIFYEFMMMPMIIFGRYYSIYVILHLATANYCQWIA
jgi:hypothetical protein